MVEIIFFIKTFNKKNILTLKIKFQKIIKSFFNFSYQQRRYYYKLVTSFFTILNLSKPLRVFCIL